MESPIRRRSSTATAPLGRLRTESLIVWGEVDQWLPAAYVVEYGWRSRIPGGGHNVHEDDPRAVNPVLRDFLTDAS